MPRKTITFTFTKTLRGLCTTGLCAFALSACDNSLNSLSGTTEIKRDIITPTGSKLGTLTLTTLENGTTQVTVNVKDLSTGTHAMHFHETGLCEAPDFKSSGGHFNPTQSDHGMEMPNGPHAGDMMNIEVGADSTASFTITNSRVSIDGQNSLPALLDDDGSALIIHEKADDYISQPSGAAGSRIGCAVISR